MLTMEMVLHKDVDFAPKFGKNRFFCLFSLHLYTKQLKCFKIFMLTKCR